MKIQPFLFDSILLVFGVYMSNIKLQVNQMYHNNGLEKKPVLIKDCQKVIKVLDYQMSDYQYYAVACIANIAFVF